MVFSLFNWRVLGGRMHELVHSVLYFLFCSPVSRPIKNWGFWLKKPTPGKPMAYSYPDDHAVSTFGAGGFMHVEKTWCCSFTQMGSETHAHTQTHTALHCALTRSWPTYCTPWKQFMSQVHGTFSPAVWIHRIGRTIFGFCPYYSNETSSSDENQIKIWCRGCWTVQSWTVQCLEDRTGQRNCRVERPKLKDDAGDQIWCRTVSLNYMILLHVRCINVYTQKFGWVRFSQMTRWRSEGDDIQPRWEVRLAHKAAGASVLNLCAPQALSGLWPTGLSRGIKSFQDPPLDCQEKPTRTEKWSWEKELSFIKNP